MKKAFLLSALFSAVLALGGCANQNPSATTASNAHDAQRGLVGPGSVAPINGGPATPGHVPQRFQP